MAKKEKKEVIEKIEIIKPTEDDLILGAKNEVKKVKVVDYTNRKVRYNVYIYQNKRNMTVTGFEVGTFLGQETSARKALSNGAKSVTIETIDEKGKSKPMYKIEVID